MNILRLQLIYSDENYNEAIILFRIYPKQTCGGGGNT